MSTTHEIDLFQAMKQDVAARIAAKKENSLRATVRTTTQETLATDLVNRDHAELLSILRKCTVEIFTKAGRQLRLNPYHVYKHLYTERYAGVINPESERLREQQFTAAVISGLRTGTTYLFEAATAQERAAWLEVLGETESVGVKQVTLTKSPIPLENSMFRYWREKLGMN